MNVSTDRKRSGLIESGVLRWGSGRLSTSVSRPGETAASGDVSDRKEMLTGEGNVEDGLSIDIRLGVGCCKCADSLRVQIRA